MMMRVRKKTQPVKHRPVIVTVSIYRLHVVVMIGSTAEEVVKEGLPHGVNKASFPEKWVDGLRESIETAQGLCTSFGTLNSDVLIWLKEMPLTSFDHGTLWHELSHAVDRIARECDPSSHFYDDAMNSEPRAYLYEYLAVQITRDLWNRRSRR